MSILAASNNDVAEKHNESWGGVFAMSLGVFALIASEFMPVSLLTPIATELHISEGQAGQAIAISGAFAVLASLFISTAVGRLDRKLVLLGLTAIMIVSGAIVAFAPNYVTFMIGRALIGVVIGGFWSMAAATAIRLVHETRVPRALAIFNGGNALATVIAAPLGSFLGGFIGWRGAFFCVVPIAVIVLIWQLVSLPSMKADRATSASSVFAPLMRWPVALGMGAAGLMFMGQFALFTYLRPFLETATGLDVSALSLVLLTMGVAGFIGTAVIGAFLKDGPFRALVVIPVVMAAIAMALIFLGEGFAATMTLLGAWGLIGTAAPVAWWTWVARVLPDDAEAGGGLFVAIVQLSITLGAVIGGFLFDAGGYPATFCVSAILLLLAAVLIALAARTGVSHTTTGACVNS